MSQMPPSQTPPSSVAEGLETDSSGSESNNSGQDSAAIAAQFVSHSVQITGTRLRQTIPPGAETSFFRHLSEVLDNAFYKWTTEVLSPGTRLDYSDIVLDVPTISESIVFGARPEGQGKVWEGHVHLQHGHVHIIKLRTNIWSDAFFGVYIGAIDEICEAGIDIFYAFGGQLYGKSQMSDYGTVRGIWREHIVSGGCEMSALSRDQVLEESLFY